MGPTIAGITYLSTAILTAFFIVPEREKFSWKHKSIIFWLILGVVFFVVPYKIAVLLISAILLFILRPNDNSERLLFYIVTFPAVPLSFVYQVPFPGINYLIEVDYRIIAPAILLICPAIFSKPKNQAAEWPVFLYILLIVIVSLYDLPFTSSLRYGVGLALMYFLPFIALARAQVNGQDLYKIFDALLILAVILGCLSMIFQFSKWNIYGYFDTGATIWKHQEYRYGFLRVSTSVTSISLAFLASCGIVAMSVSKSFAGSSAILRFALMAMFSLTIFFSMARGGWLAAIVMLSFYRLLLSRITNSVIMVGLFTFAALGVIYFQSAQLSDFDPYGTFEYRRELYKAALVEFYNHPIFGNIHFKSSANFANLVQGEGIIDVVSVYLNVLLSYGLFGFLLIFGAYAYILLRLFRIRKISLDYNHDFEKKIVSATISIIFSYLIMIGTVSDVFYIGTIGYILLGVGYTVVREIENRAPASAE